MIKLFLCELNLRCFQILRDPFHLCNSRNRYDKWFLCQQPRKRKLCGSNIFLSGKRLQTVTKGNVSIDDSTSARTTVTPLDSSCAIKANYVIDFSIVPELKITNLDLTDYPRVCTRVSVVDKNNGRSVYGLDSTDFILFENDKPLPADVTVHKSVKGVSVALVADESASMSGTRMVEAKNSMKAFVDQMGPYDRTAIVGFDGDDGIVHQAMTSDRALLYAGIDRLTADGSSTNITDGAYRGVEQVKDEVNQVTML